MKWVELYKYFKALKEFSGLFDLICRPFTMKEKIFNLVVIIWNGKHFEFNPSRFNPRQREKIKLIFHTSLWFLIGFYESPKGEKTNMNVKNRNFM